MSQKSFSLNKMEAYTIEKLFELYGKVNSLLLQRKLKISHKKASWIERECNTLEKVKFNTRNQ